MPHPEANGVPPAPDQLPTIRVTWDAEQQMAVPHFDPAQFRSWDFVVAILGMAKEFAETVRRVGHVNALQAEMQQQQAIARKLFRG